MKRMRRRRGCTCSSCTGGLDPLAVAAFFDLGDDPTEGAELRAHHSEIARIEARRLLDEHNARIAAEGRA
jgi:hypothetical protein